MRYFKDIIFLGNEDCIGRIKLLRERLEYGISLLSGLQQPDHPESEEHAEQCKIEREKDELELNDIVDDIKTALLGE